VCAEERGVSVCVCVRERGVSVCVQVRRVLRLVAPIWPGLAPVSR